MMADSPWSYAVGVIAVTLDSLLSGFATVYFEKVLKTTVLTVWDRNLQLAFWSVLIYLPWAVLEHPDAPLHGMPLSVVTFWLFVHFFISCLQVHWGLIIITAALAMARALSGTPRGASEQREVLRPILGEADARVGDERPSWQPGALRSRMQRRYDRRVPRAGR